MDWSTDLQQLGLVVLAAGLGAVIGAEREISGKPAGLRTHIFVAAGSTLLMLLGNSIIDEFAGQGSEFINADPIRILQAIVVGISFLGGGTIIHHKGKQVEGLTTAASIYFTAGIGVAVAIERLLMACCVTLFAVIVLAAVGWIEYRLARLGGKSNEQRSD